MHIDLYQKNIRKLRYIVFKPTLRAQYNLCNYSKPGTANLGAISKAQNCSPFGLYETRWLQNMKKIEGGPLGDFEKFPKKNEIF